MSNLDKYFAKSETEDLHPKVRHWRAMLQENPDVRARCEFWRKKEGLAYSPAKLFVAFSRNDQLFQRDEIDWDPDVDLELIRLHVPAISPENESKRLALLLQHWFVMPETRYGDGFFNSVLYNYLRSSAFAERQPIREMLAHIHEYPPSLDSRSVQECVEAIESVIGYTARALVEQLKYDRTDAESILTYAIAHYLDERFSVSNRRLLGFG